MATKAPRSRKTHVTRIFGTNKKKEILQDIWVDVERIDRSTSTGNMPGTNGRQKIVRRFRWRDDPTDLAEYLDPDLEDTDTLGTFKRVTKLVKVCSPDEEDLNDPLEWVPVRAIKRIKLRNKSQKTNVRQLQYEKLINEDLQDSRVVKARRIFHYDTNIDDDAQKACDNDPNLKMYVVKGSEYIKKDGTDTTEDTKDDTQYVEHEIVTKIIHKGNSVYYGDDPTDADTGKRQVRKTKFLNEYLIDDSEPAKLEERGLNDFNPPYRLDPFQNIVNVNFAGAVKFHDKSYASIIKVPETSNKMLISFWVRVPQKSIDAHVKAQAKIDNPKLKGCLPLVVWGKKGKTNTGATDHTSPDDQLELHSVGYFPGPLSNEYTLISFEPIFNGISPFATLAYVNDKTDYNLSAGPVAANSSYFVNKPKIVIGEIPPKDTDPSFIGLNCNSNPPTLVVNIESGKKGDVVGYNYERSVTKKTVTSVGGESNVKQGTITAFYIAFGPSMIGNFLSLEDNTHFMVMPDGTSEVPVYSQKDISRQVTDGTGAIENKGPDIEPDKWHHVMISVDFNTVATHGAATSTEPLGTLKSHVDSAAKMYIAVDDKNYLWDEDLEKNNLITDNARSVAFSYPANEEGVDLAQPTYKLSKPSISFEKFSVPASEEYAGLIREIEIGAFQLFTGVAPDTSSENIRRLFITKKSDAGIQKPAARNLPIDYFGKEPDVKHFSVGSWKKETVTGKIESYTPTPNLGGNQGKD